MNFEQALFFRGIDPKKPIEMIYKQWHWYGILKKDEFLDSYMFFGILKGDPMAYRFAPVDLKLTSQKFGFEFLSGELFGSNAMPNIDDDETLWRLQTKNPFIGTTQYPDAAMAMRNISRLKLAWILLKDFFYILRKFAALVVK